MNRSFKINFGFEPDPDCGAGATLEESRTWGRFRINLDETNLCQHIADGKIEEDARWYLLSLLEWFVFQWDALLHESKLPGSFKDALSAHEGYWRSVDNADTDFQPEATVENDGESEVSAWWGRHAIRAATLGGIFPDVFIRRLRNEIEISWGHTGITGAPGDLRFLAPKGSASVVPRVFACELYRALGCAVNDLSRAMPDQLRVVRLSDRFGRLREPTFSRGAWMAGLGSSVQESIARLDKISQSLGAQFQDLIVPEPEELVIMHPPAALVMFGSTSPHVTETDVAALLGLLKAAFQPFRKALLPRMPFDEISESGWKRGYGLAIQARNELSIPEFPYKLDVSAVYSKLGVAIRDIVLSDNLVRGVAIYSDKLAPVVALNRSCTNNDAEAGQRFTLAHELGHLLFDQEHGTPLAVVSGPWAPAMIEKQANAFAAMLLMPIGSCRRLFDEHRGNDGLSRSTIEAIAERFGTGKMATLYHLSNIGLIDRDELYASEQTSAGSTFGWQVRAQEARAIGGGRPTRRRE